MSVLVEALPAAVVGVVDESVLRELVPAVDVAAVLGLGVATVVGAATPPLAKPLWMLDAREC